MPAPRNVILPTAKNLFGSSVSWPTCGAARLASVGGTKHSGEEVGGLLGRWGRSSEERRQWRPTRVGEGDRRGAARAAGKEMIDWDFCWRYPMCGAHIDSSTNAYIVVKFLKSINAYKGGQRGYIPFIIPPLTVHIIRAGRKARSSLAHSNSLVSSSARLGSLGNLNRAKLRF
jgi:hypothetical protein